MGSTRDVLEAGRRRERQRRNPHPAAGTPADWLVGGGELGELIRCTDWSSSPLGPRADWPQSLRTVVNVVVESRYPNALLWGPDLLLLYNDAYRVIAADRHPTALGRSTRVIWSEVWHINEPILAAVMQRGESRYFEDMLFPINRRGRMEDAYFTLCYSPVRVEDGTVGGTLVTLRETTVAVERETRLRESERRLQAAVESSGETFRALADNSPDNIDRMDRESRHLYVNPAAASLYRLAPGDVVGRTNRELGTPDPRADIWEDRVRHVFDTGRPLELEDAFPAKDGTRFWQVRCVPREPRTEVSLRCWPCRAKSRTASWRRRRSFRARRRSPNWSTVPHSAFTSSTRGSASRT